MKNVKRLLMSSCVVLALLGLNSCTRQPPRYDVCVFYNSMDRIYCKPSNGAKPYDAKPTTEYLLLHADYYSDLYKYAKQVEKDLERCKR